MGTFPFLDPSTLLDFDTYPHHFSAELGPQKWDLKTGQIRGIGPHGSADGLLHHVTCKRH